MIEPSDRRLLLLARAAVEARVRQQPPPPRPYDLVVIGSGAFVTLHCDERLRGCLGTLKSSANLVPSIMRLAEDVSHLDHRFPPIVVDELARLIIELSILTPREIVTDVAEIVIGRDGLVVELGRHRGLLLPQVATDYGWDRETFLAQTCVKAGLQSDAWQRGAIVSRFSAEVFADPAPPIRPEYNAVEYAANALAAGSASGVFSRSAGGSRAHRIGRTASSASLTHGPW
jgi:AmmeMemoRadiSam system protein A